MESCYICLDEINNGQPCYGHVANDRYYRPVNSAAEGRDAVIHAIHLECLKGIMAAENAIHPNRCGCCRADLDIPAGSPLGDVYRSPEIQGNEGLRQRWIQHFPGVRGGEQPARRVESEGMRGMREFIRARRREDAPVGARENACRQFSSIVGTSVHVIVTATLITCVTVPYLVSYSIAVGVIRFAMGRTLTKVAHFVSTHKLPFFERVALLCACVAILLGIRSTRGVVKAAIRGVQRTAGRIWDWGIDGSFRCGERSGAFAERKVFAITNGVTCYVANTRLFRRAA